MPDYKAPEFSANHFSLANPVGSDRSDVPLLLRRMAEHLEEYGPVTVMDMVLHWDIEHDGGVYSLTVYFRPLEERQTVDSPIEGTDK